MQTLFKTGWEFPMEDTNLPIYENMEKHLFVIITKRYPNGEVAHQHIRPIKYGDRPYQSNEAGGENFTGDHLSLGKKSKDFRTVEVSRREAELVEEHLTFAICSLTLRVKELEELIGDFENLSKDVSKLRNQYVTINQFFRGVWESHKGLIATLQNVFKRKKWRKRFDKHCEDFYEELNDDYLTKQDDVPF